MKKIVTALKACAAVMLVALVASCGQKAPTVEEVAAKVNDGQALTQADYKTMIDYVGEYAAKAQDYYNQINAQPNDSTAQYIEASNELAALYAKYTYLDSFRTALSNADASNFDDTNLELVNKYSKDQGFPLPVGEGAAMQDPNVVGMIQDMPSTGTTDSTGVLSTGDGEAVNMNAQ